MCSTTFENNITPVQEGEAPKKKCSGKCKDCRKKKSKASSLVKTIGVMLVIMTGNFALFAQNVEPAQRTFWDDPFSDPMLPIYLVTLFLVVVILLVGLVAIYIIKILNMLAAQAEKERAQKLGIAYVPKPTWWDKFSQQMNASVPVEKEKSIELDHNYDGIKELDNHLPPWWKWLFYGTIGWSAVYLFVFHVLGSLPLQTQEYQNELSVAEEQAIKFKASQPQAVIDEATLVYSSDEAILTNGKQVYNTNCVACHKNDGGGNAIGPNLTDQYWIHGGDVKNIYATIKTGVVEKGMPAWGKSMSPKDVRDVAFYVMSLQGTNPPNAKAPQGDLFKPVPDASDSTKIQASL